MRNALLAVLLVLVMSTICMAHQVAPYSYDIQRQSIVLVPQVKVDTFRVYPRTEIRQTWLFPNLYWHRDIRVVVPLMPVPAQIQNPSNPR